MIAKNQIKKKKTINTKTNNDEYTSKFTKEKEKKDKSCITDTKYSEC